MGALCDHDERPRAFQNGWWSLEGTIFSLSPRIGGATCASRATQTREKEHTGSAPPRHPAPLRFCRGRMPACASGSERRGMRRCRMRAESPMRARPARPPPLALPHTRQNPRRGRNLAGYAGRPQYRGPARERAGRQKRWQRNALVRHGNCLCEFSIPISQDLEKQQGPEISGPERLVEPLTKRSNPNANATFYPSEKHQ